MGSCGGVDASAAYRRRAGPGGTLCASASMNPPYMTCPPLPIFAEHHRRCKHADTISTCHAWWPAGVTSACAFLDGAPHARAATASTCAILHAATLRSPQQAAGASDLHPIRRCPNSPRYSARRPLETAPNCCSCQAAGTPQAGHPWLHIHSHRPPLMLPSNVDVSEAPSCPSCQTSLLSSGTGPCGGC
jgi:hypothetical protein